MISEEINRIKTAKADIKTAIENKGVEVSSNAKIDDYASLIDDISSGGGSSKYGKFYDSYNGGTTGIKVDSILEEVVIPKEIVTLNIDMRYTYIKKFKFELGSLCTTFTDGSFYNVTSLISLELPPLLTALRPYLCSGTSIQTITIPSGVVSIPDNCFSNCRLLSTVNILGNITSIGACAFQNCLNIESFTIPSTVTSILTDAFRGSGIVTADLSNVTTLGNNVFSGCTKLLSCVLYNNITSIPQYTFYNTQSLVNITIPSSVTTIGTYAFANSGITNLTIPNGVTSIGNGAFEGCTSLTGITCLATTPPTLGRFAFDSTNNCTIYVPAESVEAYKVATDWSNLASRIQAIPSE